MTCSGVCATISVGGGAALDLVVYPVAAYSFTFRFGQTPKMTTAPHGSRRAGFSFAPGVFRGLFAVCFICHFNAPVRRFNSGSCPYISPALCALYALFMALWRGVAPSAVHCRFAVCCQLAAIVRRPCALGGVAGPSMLAVASGGGAPLCQSRCHSCRESCKSRWHSRSLLCKSRYESRQCLR